MPYCAAGQHRCADTPISAYVTMPGDGPQTGDRFRSRFCVRHGRQALSWAYRFGVDMLSEGGDPHLCIACGQPTCDVLLELSIYEGEWGARFAALACSECAPHPLQVDGEPPVSAEKLPPREKLPQRRTRR